MVIRTNRIVNSAHVLRRCVCSALAVSVGLAIDLQLLHARQGRVEGIVTESESGQPIAAAHLELISIASAGRTYSATQKSPREAWTDAAGRFSIGELERGRFRIVVTKSGLAPLLQGDAQAVLDMTGSSTSVSISLKLGAVICGQIVFATSGVQPDVSVSAMLLTPVSGGQPVPDTIQIAQLDASGGFCLVDLPEGRYVLIAVPRVPSATEADRTNSNRSFTPMFYPGTPVRNSAHVFEIRAGEVVSGLRFTLSVPPH